MGGSGPKGEPRPLAEHPLPSPGRNEPLKKERPKWKSDYPMTDGQLRSKRDEFWDTAPAFEGRKEIWDALKAAAYAVEANDHSLAQAILDGASITLPHGEGRYQGCGWGGCRVPHIWAHGGPQVGEERDSQLPSIQLSPTKGGNTGSTPLPGVALSPYGWSMVVNTDSISLCHPQGP